MAGWNLEFQLLLCSGRVPSSVAENEVGAVVAFVVGVVVVGQCEVSVVENEVEGVVVDVIVVVNVVGEGVVAVAGV